MAAAALQLSLRRRDRLQTSEQRGSERLGGAAVFRAGAWARRSEARVHPAERRKRCAENAASRAASLAPAPGVGQPDAGVAAVSRRYRLRNSASLQLRPSFMSFTHSRTSHTSTA